MRQVKLSVSGANGGALIAVEMNVDLTFHANTEVWEARTVTPPYEAQYVAYGDTALQATIRLIALRVGEEL